MTEKPGTYYDMPDGMFPVHLFHPEFQSLDMWFPAKDAWVLEWLCRKTNCDDALEIGSFAGMSASILKPHFRRLLCVDTWNGSGPDDQVTQLYEQHDVLSAFQRNLNLIGDGVSFHHRRLNPDTLPEHLNWRGVKYDLVFIDAAHDYDSVMADLKLAEQWVSPCGILCGHDYTFLPGVTAAVNDFGFDGALGTVWWKEMA